MTNSLLCNRCIFSCKNCMKDCKSFIRAVNKEELAQLNKDIRIQNVNMKRFAKANGLKYTYLIKMLKGREQMTYKVLTLLQSRLNEKEEWIPYLNKF